MNQRVGILFSSATQVLLLKSDIMHSRSAKIKCSLPGDHDDDDHTLLIDL
jgi:hypothetical protein